MPKAIKVGNRRIQLDNIAYIHDGDEVVYINFAAMSDEAYMDVTLSGEEAKQFLEMYDAVMGTIEYEKEEAEDGNNV